MLALALFLVTGPNANDAPPPSRSSRPSHLGAAALSSAGAAAGGAMVPLTLMAGVYGSIAVVEQVQRVIPPPAPGNFSAGEGYGECVVVPAVLCIVGPAELIGVATGAGLSGALAYVGASSGVSDDDAKLAGLRGAAGSCAGCLAGFAGLCAYSCMTSTTQNATTTFGAFPSPAVNIGVLMSTSALGAALAAGLPLALADPAPTSTSMRY